MDELSEFPTTVIWESVLFFHCLGAVLAGVMSDWCETEREGGL